MRPFSTLTYTEQLSPGSSEASCVAVVVEEINKGSPAEVAGLKADDVILEVCPTLHIVSQS
jgi:S1-C subfamily serine protease